MIYTLDDIHGFVVKAAAYVAYRYRTYRIEQDDIQQEIYVWVYGDGKAKIERWLESDPQQTTRIYRSMLDQGLRYAENEKAAVAGYKPDDVWWYTPAGVEGILPLALDRSFTQANGHVGELITMVIDIRKALDTTDLFGYFTEHLGEKEDDRHEDWRVNLQLVIDHLGGERPAVGRRRRLSNAQAQAVTAGAYE